MKQIIHLVKQFGLMVFIGCVMVILGGPLQTIAKPQIELIIGQYDCVTDADCPGGICLLDEHVCMICDAPKVLQDKECVCPEGMYDNGKSCVSCEEPAQIWTGKECVCNEALGYHLIEGNCQACPTETPVWNGTKCVECKSNPDCTDGTKPWCDISDNTCKPCPADRPYWNGKTCGCNTNDDCDSPQRPWCDTVNHVCQRCPSGSVWDHTQQNCVCSQEHMVIQDGKCGCDTENGWYDDLEGGCTQINCVAHTEPFTAKSSLTFCTEHNRWIRVDTLENELRVSFLDGWNGYHNYDYTKWGCRCTEYNTYNTTGTENGHWSDATVHKIGYAGYQLKFPIYFKMSGVGCDEGTYTISSAGVWTDAGLCAGSGSTETNISYAIQTEIEGYKCPIEGASCTADNKCVGGRFDLNKDNICGLPGASTTCNCPFGKKKIDGSCDWRCTNGQIIQEDGTCGCPKGMTYQNNWCRAACDEQNGYTWDVQQQKCVCDNETGYYTNSEGRCVYCFGPTKKWNEATKTCVEVCTEQTYVVATAWYSDLYPTGRWNKQEGKCECNPDIFFYGTYPNCKRCQSKGTAYDEKTGNCICDAEQGYPLENGECDLCLPGSKPNAAKNGCVCAAPNQVMHVKGECGSCNEYTEEIQVNDEVACQLCIDAKTRFWNPAGNTCVRCDSRTTKSNISKEDCTICSERIWLNNNSCALCTARDTYTDISQEQCQRCEGHYWKSDNTCYSCWTRETQTDITEQECRRCGNLCWHETTPATETSVALGTCGVCSIFEGF